MSSDEDKYFNIPTTRTIKELKDIIETRYKNILNIDFDKKRIIKIFVYSKIKRNLD